MIFEDLRDLGIARRLEDAFEVIRAEVDDVPDECYELWPQPEFLGSWRMMPLIYDDRPPGFRRTPEANRVVVPETSRLLLADDSVVRAALSLLGPQTHIPSHDGRMDPAPFRTHLGIQVPEQSGLRVADHRIRLPVGKLIGFDPRMEHEAANMSTDEDRLVLIVDLRLTEAVAAKYLPLSTTD